MVLHKRLISVLFISLLFVTTPAFAAHYYLAQYDWHPAKDILDENNIVVGRTQNMWLRPLHDKSFSSLDLRPLKFQGPKGLNVEGYGLFAYYKQETIPGSIYLGEDLDTPLPTLVKKNIAKKLGKSGFSGATLREIIWEYMVLMSDSTDPDAIEPMLPDHNLKIKLEFAGEIIQEKTIVPGVSPEWDKTLQVIHENYKRFKGKGSDGQFHRRMLTYWKEKYGLPTSTYIPADEPIVSPLPHNTTITHDLEDMSASVALDTHADWTLENGSNSTTVDVSGDIQCDAYRYNHSAYSHGTSLSSDDHYVQCVATCQGQTGEIFVYIRLNGTDLTVGYNFRIDISATNAMLEAYKMSSGPTWTTIGTDQNVGSITDAAEYVLKAQFDGSAYKSWWDGTLYHDSTDATHSGQTQVGWGGYGQGAWGSTRPNFDDFEAADLAAASGPKKGAVMVVN